MHIIIDLDGVIAEEEEGWDYTDRVPLPEAVAGMVVLKEQQHTITIYSSRFTEDHDVTTAWLCRHGIPFDNLILGKPRGDLYIDDRGFRFTDWSDMLKEMDEISY